MKKIQITTVLFGMLFGLLMPANTLAGSWGLERGRADEGDAVRLVTDQIAMKRARTRIDKALGEPLAVERQKALAGKTGSDYASAGELLDSVKDWWLKDVMGPARAIVDNPAASCAEAATSLQVLLEMMRNRSLFALENDFDEIYDEIQTKGYERCREEALDECLVTGRFIQIPQLALTQERQLALMGGAGEAQEWAKASLKQCAVYELQFVSTTKASQIFNLETVRRSKITLEFEFGAGGLWATLSDILKGETLGDVLLDSAKCSQPPLQVTCKPGTILTQNTANVIEMELRHREFYVDKLGMSKEQMAGEDKFEFKFGGGIYGVDAVVKVQHLSSGKIPDVPVPMKGVGYGFYIAHKKDLVAGQGTAVKIFRTKRGAYPVLFDFIYVDQDTASNATVYDSTEFKLIHKPKPVALPPRGPKEPRKPLKPRKPIGG